MIKAILVVDGNGKRIIKRYFGGVEGLSEGPGSYFWTFSPWFPGFLLPSPNLPKSPRINFAGWKTTRRPTRAPSGQRLWQHREPVLRLGGSPRSWRRSLLCRQAR